MLCSPHLLYHLVKDQLLSTVCFVHGAASNPIPRSLAAKYGRFLIQLVRLCLKEGTKANAKSLGPFFYIKLYDLLS
jgi:hypothetical protein